MSAPNVPKNSPWQTRGTREVYQNPWISVREDAVLTPSHTDGIYGVVMYHNRAIGVVPVDADGYTWLVGQWRYCHDSYEWEIPMGGCPPHEVAESCAKRELQEETGLVAGTLRLLLSGLQLSNSTTNEKCDLFLATDLVQSQACPEDTEELHVWRLPLKEAIRMAKTGEIRDAPSVAALLFLASENL